MKPRVLIINGSYREGGVTDQIIAEMSGVFAEQEIPYEVVQLRREEINFCTNCRACTQQEGEFPGECVQDDGMRAIIEKIESSNAFVIASPTNFYTVTALFKRFLERLVVYGYWPWGTDAPQFRRKTLDKRSLLVSSCAAPGLIGRLFYASMKMLRECSKVIGAKPAATLFLGMVSKKPDYRLSEKEKRKARDAGLKLLNSVAW